MLFFLVALWSSSLLLVDAQLWNFIPTPEVASYSVDVCAYVPWASLCQCRLHPLYMQRLKDALVTIFGQEEAMQQLSRAVALHEFEVNDRPTVIHIAGDNGVGKTLTTKIMAQSIFLHTGPSGIPDGYLYIRGNMFKSSTKAEELRKLVSNHLAKCPASIITLDEAELVHPATLSVFRDFFDSTIPVWRDGDTKVEIGRAIFIFISDFGIEGTTELKSREEVKNLVHYQSLSTWKDLKQSSLIQHIIPFYPITKEGLTGMVNYLLTFPSLSKYSKMRVYTSISKEDRQALIDLLYEETQSLLHRNKNYRGLREIFDMKVLSQALTQLQEEETNNQDTIIEQKVVTIKVEGNDVLVRVVR